MKKRLSKNARLHIGDRLVIKWGTSRGQYTYGYTTCTLRCNGTKVSGCNGGGYDMKGTVIGNYVTWAFASDLRKIKEQVMPENSHWEYHRDKDGNLVKPDGGFASGERVSDGRYFHGLTFHDPNYDPGKAVIGDGASEGKTVEQAEKEGSSLDGACGYSTVLSILNAIGLTLDHVYSSKREDVFVVKPI